MKEHQPIRILGLLHEMEDRDRFTDLEQIEEDDKIELNEPSLVTLENPERKDEYKEATKKKALYKRFILRLNPQGKWIKIDAKSTSKFKEDLKRAAYRVSGRTSYRV